MGRAKTSSEAFGRRNGVRDDGTLLDPSLRIVLEGSCENQNFIVPDASMLDQE